MSDNTITIPVEEYIELLKDRIKLNSIENEPQLHPEHNSKKPVIATKFLMI